ncbi:phosphatidylglycerophosphatase A family protein [Geoalkalibacter sp.]|jgi:phosphatidylglycerophosphatase A|uniref:phosphatidylglycerophosphatase A family protein n=1 Tax=Geoalkalibacter sp. TaxID=3041440 RepID=UPI00272EA323|nr:phosphatidylglycerophosphatase A [Geoalkalibacter sp.]
MKHARTLEQRLILLLASNGGLGYFPWAPGTVGTLAGIPAFWLLARFSGPLYALTWVALLCLACWVAAGAGRLYGVVDDRRIVIDELVGYLVTVAFLPFSWTTALLGFVFFRFFDVVKIWPASWCDQRLKNGVGVVLDDVAAGFYAALALRLCLAWLG